MTLIAITCKHLQRDIDDYRPKFAELGLELTVPPVTGQQLGGPELLAAMEGVAGVIAGDDLFSREVLEQCDSLRVISKWGIGLDSIDLDFARERGVVVTNTPGMFNDEVAEMALGYLLALLRGIVDTDRAVRQGQWPNPVGRTLRGMRVAVLGLGNIGLELATKLIALGVNVVGVDTAPDALQQIRDAGGEVAALDAAMAEADAVICTLPLSPGTQGLVGRDQINLMRDRSFLVNVGRGPVVQEAAVVEALETGKLAGAALDVFEIEPLPAESPLRNLAGCVLGTHNSSNTAEACRRTHERSIANLLEQLANKS